MQAFDTDPRMPTELIWLQYAAVDNLCAAFDALVEGATLRFYPYGGSLYRAFMPDSTSKHTKTNDVDGFLVVVPHDVTLQDCLTTDDEKYGQVVERIVDVYETLHNVLFNLNGFTEWMRRSSSESYTFSCPEFMDVFKGKSKNEYTLLNPWDRDEFRAYTVLNTAMSVFQELMPLFLHFDGKMPIMLDVHFGVLQPVRDNMSGRLCEIMARAAPWPGYAHIWKQNVFTFFIEQCRTMVECLNFLYRDVVLPDADGYDNADRVRRLMTQTGSKQSIVKAEKRLMRVNELVHAFPHLTHITLKDVYVSHTNDVFAPALEYVFDVVYKRTTKEFLQTEMLKKKVREFNNALLWGFQDKALFRLQREVGEEEATQSDLAKALREPLRKMMAILRVREHNQVSSAFVLDDDVTVSEMMHLLTFLFERLRDKVDNLMQRARDKSMKKEKPRGAGGGEEKTGKAHFAQEMHAFKLMNRMNLRF